MFVSLRFHMWPASRRRSALERRLVVVAEVRMVNFKHVAAAVHLRYAGTVTMEGQRVKWDRLERPTTQRRHGEVRGAGGIT